MLTISQAAKYLKVSPKTLRRWESQGLLIPQRTEGNQRRYDENQIRSFKKPSHVSLSPLTPPYHPDGFVPDLTPLLQSPKNVAFRLFPAQKRVLLATAVAMAIGISALVASKSHLPQAIRIAMDALNGDAARTRLAQELTGGAVLASETAADDYLFNVSIESLFNQNVTVEGDLTSVGNLTAPNVVYNLTAGDNVTLTGDAQTPTISVDIPDQTSSLGIFKTVKVGSDSFSAGTSTDTLEFAAGDNISISTDTSNKKLTLSASVPGNSGWTDGGTIVRLSTAGDLVSVGSATGSAKLSIEGGGYAGDILTASQSGDLILKLTNTGLLNLSATGFDAGLKLQNSTTLFSGTGAPSDANGNDGDYYFRTDGTGNTSLYTKVSSSWVAAGGGSTTLQDAYDNGNTITTSNARDIDFTLANTSTDANFLVNIASGSTGSFQVQNAGTTVTTLDTSGVTTTGNLAVNGGDLTSSASTFNLLNSTPTTINFGGAATTLNFGATTGTTTIANDFVIGNAITDTITFTGRVAQDADLIPVTVTGTNDLGSSTLPWDNLYLESTQGDVFYASADDTVGKLGIGSDGQVLTVSSGVPVWAGGSGSGTVGWWQRNLGVLSPTNITDDLAIGGTATSSAKFQVFGSTGSATSAGNLTFSTAATISTTSNQSLIVNPSGGNIGLGTTAPDKKLEINSSTGNNLRLTYADSNGSAQDYTDFTLDSNGNLTISPTTDGGTTPGTVTLAASTLDTNQTTFNLINTTATTVNFAGAATTANIATAGTAVNIGAASGTTDVKNSLNVTGTLDIDGGSLTSSDTIFNLVQDTVLTLNFAGAATSISIGDSTGTTTINNATTVISGDLDVNGTSNDIAGTLNLSGNTLSSSGDLVIDATGGGVKIGTGSPSFVDLANDDLYVTQDLEVGGTIYGSLTGGVNLGFTQGSVLFIDSTGAIAQDNSNFYWNDTNNLLGIGGTPVSKLDVSGAVTGKALASFNETGDQNILTASQSGIAVFNIARVSGTAANGVTITGATTSNGPTIASTGSDTNIALSIDAAGTGALNLNNNGTGDILIGGGSGSSGCTITNSNGNLACEGDLAANSGNLTTTSSGTATLFNTNATVVNIAGAADTVNVAGGSGSTGCTVDGTTGDLTCSGTIAGGATGAVGYWQRAAGAVSPTNITDDVLVGGTATSSAKFQIFGLTGNATTSGVLTFGGSTDQIQSTSNRSLILGGDTTGDIDAQDVLVANGGFRLPSGASSGWVLTSDGNGNGSWTDTTGTGSFGAWTLSGTTIYPNSTSYDLLLGSDQVADDITKLTVTGAKTGKALTIFNESGDQNIISASASGATVFNLERDGSISLLSSDTTGDVLGITNSTLTTGNIIDLTTTYVDATGGTDSAIDINLTNNPSVSANTLRGIDLSISDADDNANTLYGVYSSVDNSGNTSVGTHSVYGGYFNATSTTAGTKTAIGLYANATGGDNNYAAIFENGNVGIGNTSPTQTLQVGTTNFFGTTGDDVTIQGLSPSIFISDTTASADDYQILNTNGLFSIRNATDGRDDIAIGDTGNVGIETTAPDRKLEINSATGVNLRLTYNDSNGSALDYTDFTLDADGNLTIAPTTDGGTTPGTVTLTASTLATDQTTFTLFDTTATTINFGGAATTLDIGAASGTTDVKNSLNVTGDIDIDGGDLTSSTTSFNLLNATVTDLNFAGNATSISIGSATGTTTVNNALTVAGVFTGQSSATISGALTLYSTPTIQSASNKSLVLGGDITGNIILSPLNNTGNVGINDTTPDASLDIIAGADDRVGLIVTQHSSGQTADLQNWNISSGDTNVAAVRTTGNFHNTIFGSSGMAYTSAYQSEFYQNDAATVYGGFFGVYHRNDTNATSAIGVHTDVTNQALAANTSMLNVIGGQFSRTITADTALSATVTNSYGVYVPTPTYGGAGTFALTNSYGTYIANNGATGVTNAYGIYLEDQSGAGTLNYSIYSAGGTMYHAGNVGIGTTAPDRAVEINQATGGNLRLTYNDSNGSAQDYTDFTLDSGGNLTIAPTTDGGTTPGTVTLTASTLAADQTTFNLINTTATTLNLGGAATTFNIGPTGSSGSIVLSGGSGDTGCTLDGTTGNFTCSGNVTTAATSGTQGWWQRNTQALSPANITDDFLIGGIATSSALFQVTGTPVTTGNGAYLTSSTLTAGNLLSAYSTSTALTTGKLGYFNWEPSSVATASGDLFAINIGAHGDTTGNLFNVLDTGSSLFSVSTTAITSALPHNFTAAGDVSMAYDLLFTNQTASYIKSNAPLYIYAGESFENNNLTLKTYGTGNIVFDQDVNGKVLIGTGSATMKFTVSDSQSATAAAMIENTFNGTDSDGLLVKLGFTGSGNANNRFITFLNGIGTIHGKIRSAGTTVSYDANGVDFAEYFVKDGSLFEPGDVVSESSSDITKSSVGYDPKLVGIVSESPGFTGGEEGENKVLVALVGQVKVKIAASSQAISKGDFITSSSVSGKATKATKPGFVIGKALENWSPGGSDKILVYLNYTWADPNNSLAFDDNGNVTLNGTVTAADIKTDQIASIESQLANTQNSLQSLESQIASISAQLASLQIQSDPGATLSGQLWEIATESGKLATAYSVQVPELTVTGQVHIGLLTIDDLTASLSSPLGEITIDGDLALSGAIKVLGDSAGKEIIPAGSTQAVIYSSAADPDSRIFTSPEEKAVAVAAQSTQSGELVIRIPSALPTPLTVNWWVVK